MSNERTGAVKALEWTPLSTGWIAHTPFHSYEVVRTKHGAMATYANQDFAWGEENTMKAAAQADYERRVLSALSPPLQEPEQEALSEQIKRLADFIMAEVPGEPSQSEGAIDTAIRWMRAKLTHPAPQAPVAAVAYVDPAEIAALFGTPARKVYLSKYGSQAYSMALFAAPTENHGSITEPYRAAIRMIREAVGELFGPAANLESEEGVLLRGPEPRHDAEAIIAALQRLASPVQPAGTDAIREALAEFLCSEFDEDSAPCHGYSWPTHKDDDGYRGDNAYVKLQPVDVQARAREGAFRILTFLGQRAALNPTSEKNNG